MFMFKCKGNTEFSKAIIFKIKAIMETYYVPTFPKKISLQNACKLIFKVI